MKLNRIWKMSVLQLEWIRNNYFKSVGESGTRLMEGIGLFLLGTSSLVIAIIGIVYSIVGVLFLWIVTLPLTPFSKIIDSLWESRK